MTLPNHFADVPPRTPNGTCVVCRKDFRKGDRRTLIGIVAGIGRHPQDGRAVAYVSDFKSSEWAHKDCDNPTARKPTIVNIPKRQVDPIMRVRDSDTKCPNCGLVFKRGDRVIPAFVVIEVGKDPETQRPAALCDADFEHFHFNCSDPQMVNGRTMVNLS